MLQSIDESKKRDEPSKSVRYLDIKPPVQDSAIAILSFFLLRIETIFLFKLIRKTLT